MAGDVNVSNLLAGAGILYHAKFGTVETDDLAIDPPSPWAHMGGTQDGLTITINREFTDLEVDQVVDVPGRRMTKRDAQLKTNLAEATLENLARVSDEDPASIVVDAVEGTALYEPTNGIEAFQPDYTALTFDGFAPGIGNRRRVFARRVLSIDNVETAYKKDGQTLLPVTFGTHYVSKTVKPYAVMDARPVTP